MNKKTNVPKNVVTHDLSKSVVKRQDGKYSNFGHHLTAQVGATLCESLSKRGQSGILKEKYGITQKTFKEDVNTTNAAGVITTALSETIYEAAIQNIEQIMGLVIQNNDLKNMRGAGALKLPKREPVVAVQVAEGAVVGYFDEGADSVIAQPQKIAVGTGITWELQKRGLEDFTRMILNDAANALSRKVASDILTGLAAGASTSVTGGISYSNVLTAFVNVGDAEASNGVKLGFLPDKLVIAFAKYGTFLNDSDVKEHSYRDPAFTGGGLYPAKPVMMFHGMEVVVTPFLPAATAEALVLDSKKAAVMVWESDVETFEGAIPGRPYDREIVALLSYDLIVLYSAAVSKVTA